MARIELHEEEIDACRVNNYLEVTKAHPQKRGTAAMQKMFSERDFADTGLEN